MDRRDFLTPHKRKVKQSTVSYRTESTLNPYIGAWGMNEVQHLLKRVMFGSTKDDITYFKTKTLSQAVDELLNPTAPVPQPPVNNYNASAADPNVSAGQAWVNDVSSDGTINANRRNSFKQWWTGVMLNQDRSIREKLTLFWANHFGTETATIGIASMAYWHNALLRQNALGNFKSLVKAVTIDAGMLRNLNGYLNTSAAPDENYGRELQELFTVGKNPVTNLADYAESDVKMAAKVLTGWSINGSFQVVFNSGRHDTTAKTFSSFYNSTTIAGRTGANGAAETDDLLTMIFSKNEVSEFIVRKLYRWFVYYKIDAATEANIIKPLAKIFRDNNYEIKPVLAALFKSEHFFDPLNQGCLIKSPVDKAISCMREFGVVFPPNDAANYLDAYGMWNYIYGWITSMGQNIGDPPNVSGWPAYYQTPQFHEIWINSDTLPKRSRFTDTMILSGYTRNNKKIVIDAVAFTKTLSNPADPNALIDEALSIIYRVPLTAATKQTIKQQILLSGQVTDGYWTAAWQSHINAPADASAYNIVNTRLKSLYQYFMNLSEYQLS